MYRSAKLPTHILWRTRPLPNTDFTRTQPVSHISTDSNYPLTVNSLMTTWQNKHFLSLTFPLKATDVTQTGVKYFVWVKVLTIVRGDERRLGHLHLRQQQQHPDAPQYGHCCSQIRAQTAHCNQVVCLSELLITVRHCTAQLRPPCRQDVPENRPPLVQCCLAPNWCSRANLSGFLHSAAWKVLKIQIQFY